MANNILYTFKLLLTFLYIVFVSSETNKQHKNEDEKYSEESNALLSDIPINKLGKYSNIKMFSLIDMLSGFTTEVNDIQKWAEDYYSSIFYDENVDIRAAAREYIQTKLSESNDWKVIERKSFPNHKFHVRKASLSLDTVVQYSGYISFEDKHLYYYFFESRSSPLKDPLVLWLEGGPGCSSLFGLFFTIGPSKYDQKDNYVYYNPWSWNHRSSLIFLDQPVDVGFSYSDNQKVSSTAHASWNFYIFMILFFTAFPQYSHLDFHMAGQSYAGHYLPIFASEIAQYRKYPLNLTDIPASLERLPEINIKSIMIGNGIVDPYNQMPYVYYVGCDSSPWGRMLSKEQCKAMRHSIPKCRYFLELCGEFSSCECTCFSSITACNTFFLEPFLMRSINLYDRRTKSEGDIDEEYKNFSNFINQNKDFFNATSKYIFCNFNVTDRFHKKGELSESVVFFIKLLLINNIKVLIFSGDQDIICNWYGTASWVHKMKWNGSKEFNNLDFRTWSLKRKLGNKLKGTIAGQVKHHSGLTLLRVRDAGHSVGETQPEYNFEMYLRWMQGDYAFED
ncbi:hypothetical protein PNEG_02265 [Pneumocystis murina B123]|uniref:carboxypeptidase C n=1 Tax=Pneumocystis murina (strain B123) TaxID=1069680 RepID=M7P636_PNEMU|nr:hypothetical protein PNEG_02265 [Pneumocystis murina B123]EMR09305.1 hypothetical protein PNEG_02265 [Pneumocystis murina B123]